jgi:hypothetical protein
MSSEPARIVGDLVDAVDEDEAAHGAELGAHRVRELQRELRERRDGPRDVGQHEELWLGRVRAAEDRVDRHAPR